MGNLSFISSLLFKNSWASSRRFSNWPVVSVFKSLPFVGAFSVFALFSPVASALADELHTRSGKYKGQLVAINEKGVWFSFDCRDERFIPLADATRIVKSILITGHCNKSRAKWAFGGHDVIACKHGFPTHALPKAGWSWDFEPYVAADRFRYQNGIVSYYKGGRWYSEHYKKLGGLVKGELSLYVMVVRRDFEQDPAVAHYFKNC